MSARPARHNAAHITDDPEAGRSFWMVSDLVAGTRQSGGPRHARRSSSKYAAHIGRVGALAVFLGVGIAAANGPGIAVAFASSDTDSASGSTSGGAAGGGGSSDSGGDGATAGASAGGKSDTGDGAGASGGASGSGSTSDSDSGAKDDDAATDQDAGSGSAGSGDSGTGSSDADDDASAGGSDAGDDSTDPQKPGSSVDPETESAVATPDEHPGGAADTTKEQAADPTGTTTTSAATDGKDHPSAAAADAAAAKADEQASAASGSAEETPAASHASVSALSVVPTSIETAEPEQAAKALVVAAALDPIFLPYTLPSVPTGGSWLDVLIASVWRDISHTWFNKKPVATYTSEQVLLTTTYTVDVVDPNGDPLSFAIVQPEHGLVTWVPFTNKFLYTPDLFYTGDPVTETFKIIFSDSVQNDKTDFFHELAHSLARSWGLAEEDDLTITIPVTVKPLYAAPLVTTVGTPSFTLQGNPVKVLSAVTITDADSDEMSGAVVKLTTLSQDGDVLGYDAPQDSPITGVWDATTKTLTLSGTGTIDQYEAALKAVTFSATQGPLLVRGVEFWVTDDTETKSLTPGVALVNVFNPFAPAIATLGTPTFTLEGDPVKVLSSVTITDADSDTLSSATVKLTTLSQDGDTLSYTAPQDNPITGVWDATTRTLTLSGTGTIDQYKEALKAVTFSATQGALLVRGVEVWVTDSTHMTSLTPGIALINVSAAPLIPLVSTLGAPNYVIGKNPVTLLASVTITDLDSENMSGAVVKINTLGQTGDVLGYIAPQDNPITGVWDAGTKTLTLSGTATKAQYEEALKAITFSATQGAALVRGFLISVTDSTGLSSGWSGAATATVSTPLAPAIGTLGAPTFTIAGDPVTVLASVTITDGDSSTLSGATVKINTLGQTGDVLGYTAPQDNPITATWDAASKTLTLTGTGTIDQYEAALKAVTFTATQGAGLVRGLLINVTDETGVQSIAPGIATIVVNAAALIPLVSTLGAPNYVIGKDPVTLLASVTITDLDSENMSGAVVKINTLGQSGDVLGYTAPQDNPITGVWDAGTKTLTLSGTATKAQYEEALKAITFSATQGAALVRGFLISVTDSTGLSSGWSGAATATVANPAAPILAAAGIANYIIGKSGSTIFSSVIITDSDSQTLSGAVLKVATLGQSGDVLSFAGLQGNPITATWDAASRTLTLTGTATADQYVDAIKAVTFTGTQGAGLVRGISVVVTDDLNVNSATGFATVNVANPAAPAIATLGAPTFTIDGSPVTVLASVTITDTDSDNLSGATVKINTLGQTGDVLSYTAPQDNPITATWDAASKTLTLTGTGTIDQYKAALKAVKFTGTQGAGLVRGLLINVIDDMGVQSLTPGIATINVNAAPLIPLVSTLGAPNFIIGKSPVKLLSSVTVTDGDSDNMSSATVKINTLGQTGDVLGYIAPQDNPITATWDAASKTLTLSGTATKAQYEAALKAVTFSATQGAGLVRGFLISVTDSTGLSSGWSGVATATVANPAAPAIATLGAPTFTIDGSPVTVLASVTITDTDSDNLSGATVKINTLGQTGDVLSYSAPQDNPITATWDAASKTLTLTGTGTIDQYKAALKAVKFSGTQGAGLVRGLLINVKDDTGLQSVAAGVATINVNAAPLIPLVSTLGAPNFIIGKSPVKLLSSVTVTDGDSDNMSSATVKINTLGQTGDVLGYTAPQDNPITATWDAASKTLTLSGTATKSQYEAALKAVTFSATQGAGLVRGFLISVTDSTGLSSGWSGAATATVANPIAPGIATLGAGNYVIGKTGTTVIASVTITDADSSVFTKATVKINTLGQTGDVLSYTAPQGNPIVASWDASSNTLTLSGNGDKDQYETALKAVKFTATQGAGLVRGFLINVTDDSGLTSVASAATMSVNNPVASAIAVATGPSGNNNGTTKTRLFSSATITDADSTVLTGATVKITVSAYSNDKIYFGGIAGIPVTGSYDSGSKTLTLTGTATLDQYEQVIEAVTWTSNQGWGIVRSFQVRVIDDSGLISPFSFVSIAPY